MVERSITAVQRTGQVQVGPEVSNTSVQRVECPRCGYDMSGANAAAGGRAATGNALCSECGLECAWADVLDPSRRDVPGFFEHAGNGVWALVTSAVRTLVWVAMCTLWRRVTVFQRVSVRRAVVWLLLVLGTMHAAGSVLSCLRVMLLLQGLWGTGAPAGSMTTAGFVWQVVSCWAYPLADVWGQTGWAGLSMTWSYWPRSVSAAVCAHMMAVVVMLALPTTRRLAKVRVAHVARAGVYGFGWVAFLCLFRIVRNVVVLFEILATRARGQLVKLPGGGVAPRLGGPSPIFIDSLPELLLVSVTLGWVAAWWWVTLKKGWGVERAGLVWVVLAITGGLAGTAAVAYRDL